MKGQAKKDFEKWVSRADKGGIGDFFDCMQMKEYEPQEDWDIDFYSLPPSMQYGVIVDWLDTVGIVIEIELDKDFGFFACVNQSSRGLSYTDTRSQARQKAIDKATEIYNKRYESK